MKSEKKNDGRIVPLHRFLATPLARANNRCLPPIVDTSENVMPLAGQLVTKPAWGQSPRTSRNGLGTDPSVGRRKQ